MNYGGKHKPVQLNTCPVCGMDGGERMVTLKVPEEFFVQCMVCGFKTKRCKTQSAATKAWNWRTSD